MQPNYTAIRATTACTWSANWNEKSRKPPKAVRSRPSCIKNWPGFAGAPGPAVPNSCPGNYSLYLERKLEREEQEAAQSSKKQALLHKELAWIRRGARSRSTKQKARIERFEKLQNEENRVEGESLKISS